MAVQERTELVFNALPNSVAGILQREQHIGHVRAVLEIKARLEADIKQLQEELQNERRSTE
jgi:hypothetical protein